MLIEYLFEMFPNWEDAAEQAIGDLQVCWKSYICLLYMTAFSCNLNA